ncbi:hypothetical protein HPB50_006546 [Hyalomma asiaticum]|uniref:Uncharacterized protein n=1 Tax=Hyalomma asiaticum TaxID=266040 RepID=A0ACB7T7C7_HYAAI|nr:hypothetical protein HPB50_006546 [Hyalomma asiaticum]
MSTEPSSKRLSKKTAEARDLREPDSRSKEILESEPTRTRSSRRRPSRHRSSLRRKDAFNSSTLENKDASADKPNTSPETATEACVTDSRNHAAQPEPGTCSAESPDPRGAPVTMAVPKSSPTSDSSLRRLSPIMRVRNFFGLSSPNRGHQDENPASTTLSPWSPDPVWSPDTEEARDNVLSRAGQDVNSKQRARKASVRFGTTTIRELSPVSESLVNQTRLIVSAITLVLITGILGAGILLFFSRSLEYGPRLGECRTASCRKAVEDMEALIDYGVEPCKDFYSHVCRRWEERQATSPDHASFLGSSLKKFLRQVNASLSSAMGSKPVQFLYAAKFYRLCESFLSTPSVSLREVLLPLQKLGDEFLDQFSFRDVIHRVVEYSLARGIATVLNVRLSRFPDGVFLRVMRGQTLSRKLGVHKSLPLADYMEEVLSEASIIYGHEFNLTHLLEIDQGVLNYVTARESREQRRHSTAILQNVSAVMSLAEWLDALNAHLPDTHRLSAMSVISIDNVDMIRELMNFFRHIVDYGVAYLCVHVLVDALRFDYARRLNTSSRELVVSSCLHATRLTMPGAATYISTQLFQKRTSEVHRFFEQIRNAISKGSAFSWMSEFRTEEAQRRLRDVDVYQLRSTWLPDKPYGYSLSDTFLISDFPSLFIRLKKREQLSLLEDPPVAHEEDIDDAFLLRREVAYDELWNSVVIPWFMRGEPIAYDDDVPPEFLLGTLGVLSARALLQIPLPRNTGGPWTPGEKVILHRFEHCVDVWASSTLNLSLRHLIDDDNPELYLWSQGVRSAYEALKNAAEDDLQQRSVLPFNEPKERKEAFR